MNIFNCISSEHIYKTCECKLTVGLLSDPSFLSCYTPVFKGLPWYSNVKINKPMHVPPVLHRGYNTAHRVSVHIYDKLTWSSKLLQLRWHHAVVYCQTMGVFFISTWAVQQVYHKLMQCLIQDCQTVSHQMCFTFDGSHFGYWPNIRFSQCDRRNGSLAQIALQVLIHLMIIKWFAYIWLI